MILSSTDLILSKKKYIMDLLHEVAMNHFKVISTPTTSTIVFDPSPDDHLVDGALFGRIIGKLHYLSFTHSDVAFVIYRFS